MKNYYKEYHETYNKLLKGEISRQDWDKYRTHLLVVIMSEHQDELEKLK